MTITRIDTDETYDAATGKVTCTQVVRDVTADAIMYDLHTKARQALAGNAAFLALATPTNAQTTAQVKALTRQTNALIRLLVAADLLTDNTGT